MPPSAVCGQALQSWLLHGDDRCVDSLMNVPREVKFRVVRLALQSIEREEPGPATSATATTSNEAMVPRKRRKSLGGSSLKEQDPPPQKSQKDADQPVEAPKKRRSFEGAKKNEALEGAEKKESFELPCVTEMLADTCVRPKVILYHARLKLPSIQREISKNSSAESYSTFLQKLNLLEHAERLRPSQLPSLTESEVAESLTAIVGSVKRQQLPHVFCKALVKRQAKIDVDDFVDNLFRTIWPRNINASDTDTESETFDPFSPRACLIPDCNLESFCADVLGGDVLGALLKKEDAARILTIAQSIPACQQMTAAAWCRHVLQFRPWQHVFSHRQSRPCRYKHGRIRRTFSCRRSRRPARSSGLEFKMLSGNQPLKKSWPSRSCASWWQTSTMTRQKPGLLQRSDCQSGAGTCVRRAWFSCGMPWSRHCSGSFSWWFWT